MLNSSSHSSSNLVSGQKSYAKGNERSLHSIKIPISVGSEAPSHAKIRIQLHSGTPVKIDSSGGQKKNDASFVSSPEPLSFYSTPSADVSALGMNAPGTASTGRPGNITVKYGSGEVPGSSALRKLSKRLNLEPMPLSFDSPPRKGSGKVSAGDRVAGSQEELSKQGGTTERSSSPASKRMKAAPVVQHAYHMRTRDKRGTNDVEMSHTSSLSKDVDVKLKKKAGKRDLMLRKDAQLKDITPAMIETFDCSNDDNDDDYLDSEEENELGEEVTGNMIIFGMEDAALEEGDEFLPEFSYCWPLFPSSAHPHRFDPQLAPFTSFGMVQGVAAVASRISGNAYRPFTSKRFAVSMRLSVDDVVARKMRRDFPHVRYSGMNACNNEEDFDDVDAANADSSPGRRLMSPKSIVASMFRDKKSTPPVGHSAGHVPQRSPLASLTIPNAGSPVHERKIGGLGGASAGPFHAAALSKSPMNNFFSSRHRYLEKLFGSSRSPRSQFSHFLRRSLDSPKEPEPLAREHHSPPPRSKKGVRRVRFWDERAPPVSRSTRDGVKPRAEVESTDVLDTVLDLLEYPYGEKNDSNEKTFQNLRGEAADHLTYLRSGNGTTTPPIASPTVSLTDLARTLSTDVPHTSDPIAVFPSLIKHASTVQNLFSPALPIGRSSLLSQDTPPPPPPSIMSTSLPMRALPQAHVAKDSTIT